MRQVVAGSGGNTSDLALVSTGINGDYIKVSVALKRSTKALNTTSNSWKIRWKSYHVRHTYRDCCRQPIYYCTASKSD